jgi:hypothetical protein
MICEARLARKVRQVGDGWSLSARHVFRAGGLTDLDPELEKFAVILGAPHSGLVFDVLRVSARTSAGTPR